jgi:two-component system sensor histidine kinase MtrB
VSSLSSKWRSSLAWRVTATIVLLSVFIISLVGSALSTQLAHGIFNEKLSVSLADAEASAQSAELQLAIEQYQTKPDFKKVLDAILTVPNINGQSAGREVALFPTPKVAKRGLIYQGTSNYVSPTSIPDSLRIKTQQGQINSWQRVVLKYSTGVVENGIAVGNIISVPQTGKFEYYVLFSLNQQEQTLSLIHRALWLTGIGLVLLLGLITWLIIRQVISPVREAAQIAEQLTAGDLEQRMDVKGENEIARLGYAFNEMAVSLKQQINRLENLSRLQQRFVSDVSHELRTPLTTIRMASQVIYSAKDGFEPNVQRSAELLVAQIERFEALLTDLLEVSRFDAEAAVLDIAPLDFTSLVRRTVDYVHPSRERIISVHAPQGAITVDADSRRIERILRNLITNAIDHREDKHVDIFLAETENEAAIAVRDYGIGFNEREHKQLFERFWRADPARARIRGGSGLGLSIALEDARLHQGLLEAWGAPNRGANFVLTLPKRAGSSVVTHPLSVLPEGESSTIIDLGIN